jgi:hypothetical protein
MERRSSEREPMGKRRRESVAKRILKVLLLRAQEWRDSKPPTRKEIMTNGPGSAKTSRQIGSWCGEAKPKRTWVP